MTLKSAYTNPSIERTKKLITYLESIAGSPLSITSIRQNIFKTAWKEHEQGLINRCHLHAAAHYLRHILAKEEFGEHFEDVKTTIADIGFYVNQVDKKENTSFIPVSPNTLPATIHYKIPEGLFYKNQLPEDSRSRYDLDLLVLYALRLSLEKRVLGFLGIDFAINKNRPVSLSRFMKFAKGLSTVQYSKEVKWVEIERVNKWLNHFMHRNLRPYPWALHQAFEVLNPLLLPSTVEEANIRSFYGSTYVADEAKFHSEIDQRIKKEFPDVGIKWLNSREIPKSKKRP